MASYPVGLVETRASGRPTSATPADMGDFLMMPEVALTSDMVALRSLVTSGCSPDLLPLEKLHTTPTLLKPRAGVTQDWRDEFMETVSCLTYTGTTLRHLPHFIFV